MAAEAKRGCGYRKVGGLYLVDDGAGMGCCRLPLELSVCPCCGGGIKQTRGWTWIDAGKMFANAPRCLGDPITKSICPASHPALMGRVGLLWIGESFYPRPVDFLNEAASMGISRRMRAIPRGFEAGKTWVLFAHPKAIQRERKAQTEWPFAIVRPDGTFEQDRDGKMETFAAYADALSRAATLDLSDPIYVPGVIRIARPQGFEKIVKQSEFERALTANDDDPVVQEKMKDQGRGVLWVPVPDDDPDHQGNVHDDARKEAAVE